MQRHSTISSVPCMWPRRTLSVHSGTPMVWTNIVTSGFTLTLEPMSYYCVSQSICQMAWRRSRSKLVTSFTYVLSNGLLSIKQWLPEIRRHLEGVPFILVGTMADQRQDQTPQAGNAALITFQEVRILSRVGKAIANIRHRQKNLRSKSVH